LFASLSGGARPEEEEEESDEEEAAPDGRASGRARSHLSSGVRSPESGVRSHLSSGRARSPEPAVVQGAASAAEENCPFALSPDSDSEPQLVGDDSESEDDDGPLGGLFRNLDGAQPAPAAAAIPPPAEAEPQGGVAPPDDGDIDDEGPCLGDLFGGLVVAGAAGGRGRGRGRGRGAPAAPAPPGAAGADGGQRNF
jgi:hypothetical protein